jgi:catechol 2,3-dioxygenase-like lactoylglutathione lyase family enzyme
VQRSRAYNRAEAVGNPCGYLPPAGGLQNIIYRDTQNDILELWRGGSSTTGTGNLTRACNGPGASGDPFVYLEPPTGTQIALFRGVDGHVNSIYWSTGDVGYDHLTASVGAPKAVGNPIGYFETAANTNHVIYRKADSNLHELWWTGQAAVSHGDITGLAGALKATGDPTAFYDSTSATNVVFYRATDGHIHSLYWSTGPIGHDNLSGFAQAPKAAGDPHAYYTAHNNANQVVYRGVDGHIHELWWVGAEVVSHWDISAIAGAPTSGSDPVSFYSPHTNTKHVFYRATDGHLIELWWFPGGGAPAFVDLTVEAWAPVAVGKPSAFADGPYRHVVFRAADNHIHEIRFW